MEKKQLCIVFGGQSSEHEVSCVSAATVVKKLRDNEKYEITLIGITKDGHWIYTPNVEAIKDGSWRLGKISAIISPDTEGEILFRNKDEISTKKIDVVFPVLHGLFGEDGTIQGLLEMAHIPYVGCGHLSSAVTMDKFFTKVICDNIGVVQAKYVPVRDYELKNMDAVVARIEAERQYPMFIKPSNAGSSKGITKAHDREELIRGLVIAADNDSKILVEEAIVGRELECAVFGCFDDVYAASVGEILAAAEFYDYDAKYNNAASQTILDPELPEGKKEELMETAIRIFKACDGFGFSRVDFFLEKDTNRIVFNEINTIPGHTSISMYPMLMKNAGHSMEEYLDQLIEMAVKRHKYYKHKK